MTDGGPLGQTKKAPRYWETSDFWKDAGERIVTVFLFAFIGSVTSDGFVFSKNTLIAAAIAAGLSTVKALIGAARKDTVTPVSIL